MAWQRHIHASNGQFCRKDLLQALFERAEPIVGSRDLFILEGIAQGIRSAKVPAKTHTHRHRDTQRYRYTDRHRGTQRDTETHRETQKDTERHRETQRDTERHRQTHRQRHRQTNAREREREQDAQALVRTHAFVRTKARATGETCCDCSIAQLASPASPVSHPLWPSSEDIWKGWHCSGLGTYPLTQTLESATNLLLSEALKDFLPNCPQSRNVESHVYNSGLAGSCLALRHASDTVTVASYKVSGL